MSQDHFINLDSMAGVEKPMVPKMEAEGYVVRRVSAIASTGFSITYIIRLRLPIMGQVNTWYFLSGGSHSSHTSRHVIYKVEIVTTRCARSAHHPHSTLRYLPGAQSTGSGTRYEWYPQLREKSEIVISSSLQISIMQKSNESRPFH